MKRPPGYKPTPADQDKDSETIARLAAGNDSWSLADFSKSLQASADRLEEDVKKINVQLGAPDLVRDRGEYGIYGYWRIKGGIAIYRRRPDGQWDPWSRNQYTDEDVNILKDVQSKPERQSSDE